MLCVRMIDLCGCACTLFSVPEYKSEYATGLSKIMTVAKQAGARVTILGTTPAHNTVRTKTHLSSHLYTQTDR